MSNNYAPQIIAANLACLTTLLGGCWISWASVSLNKLSDTEPDLEQIGFRLSKYEISWMTCLLDFGNFSSPILACVLMDKIGRNSAEIQSFKGMSEVVSRE
ncbi:hypothetical protein M8J77_015830 [Diaphorina citri]|nr:hypothetical protein M8J77_015830 [Diaphorina citri]